MAVAMGQQSATSPHQTMDLGVRGSNLSARQFFQRVRSKPAVSALQMDSSNNPILWDVLGANLVNGGCLGQRWLWSD